MPAAAKKSAPTKPAAKRIAKTASAPKRAAAKVQSDIHTAVTPLSGKRVLVTGGSTGIGRAICALLAADGAHVITFARSAPDLNEAVKHARAAGGVIDSLVADVADQKHIARVFKTVDEAGPLDVLIDNAGISADGIEKGKDEDWRYAMETNLIGAMAVAREALARMKRRKRGDIVLIGSISADTRGEDSSVYVASKAGMQGFAESLRKEAARDGVRVSLIEPGQVGSDMQEDTPKQQRARIRAAEMLRAEDIAVAVRYVLTQPARCVIGAMTIVPLKQGLE